MRPQTLKFRLSAAAAITALTFASVVPTPVLAQAPPPPGAPVADQQQGDPPAQVGRVAAVDGTVSYHPADADQWNAATLNYPVSTGDAYWTEPQASAQLEVGASRIALSGSTEFDVGVLDENGLQATAAQGEIYLHLRNLAPGQSWSVQTPRGQVTLAGDGRYAIFAGDTENPTVVTVLEGSAQLNGPGLAAQIDARQAATITGTDSFTASIGPAEPDGFVSAMLQAERPPPRPAVAPPPVVAQMPGGDELAAYGTWSETPDYGQIWYPQVDPGWVPYRDGHWAYIAPWGWTWVDDARWGFAPFHYGRWVEVGGRWGWTPGVEVVAGPPVYAPALVTFLGVGAGVAIGVGIGAALAAGSIGWLPLGPREPYRPWYHTSDRYFREVNRHSVNVTNITVINRNVTVNNFANRGAATFVPTAVMAGSRPVRNAVQRVDPARVAQVQPVIGREPIRPTAATAGVSTLQARRLNLAPAPAGVAAAPRRAAPGPAFQPAAVSAGAIRGGTPAPRPQLRTPATVGGTAAVPGGPGVARPGFNAGPGGAGPGGRPPLMAPGSRPPSTPGAQFTPGAGSNFGPGGVPRPGTPSGQLPQLQRPTGPGQPKPSGGIPTGQFPQSQRSTGPGQPSLRPGGPAGQFPSQQNSTGPGQPSLRPGGPAGQFPSQQNPTGPGQPSLRPGGPAGQFPLQQNATPGGPPTPRPGIPTGQFPQHSAPTGQPLPQVHTPQPTPQFHPQPQPQPQFRAQPQPTPQFHPQPQPQQQFHPQPQPQQQFRPQPQPQPQFHPQPQPQFHPQPQPQFHPQPQPQPQFHPAPQPAPHPQPAPQQQQKRPGER